MSIFGRFLSGIFPASGAAKAPPPAVIRIPSPSAGPRQPSLPGIPAPMSVSTAGTNFELRRFAECVDFVLRHEGGYVDHPRDPGGATNFGISLRYARSKGAMFDLDKDGDVDKDDIVLVRRDMAAQVYKDWFWRDVRADELVPGIDLCTFDYAVNSGPGRAIRGLQSALGVKVDGFFGPGTLAAVRGLKPAQWADIADIMCTERLRFLRGLATWPSFGNGWTTRVNDCRGLALKMAGRPI